MAYREPLKPLRNLGAFDGVKEKADIPRDVPMRRICNHKDVEFKGNELRCKCGVGYKGANLQQLYLMLKNQDLDK